jgi:hypothetical protein
MAATIEPLEAVCLGNLGPGTLLDVVTKHHCYRIEYMRGKLVRITGHPIFCSTPIVAELLGSTDELGSVQAGLIGCGMHLVFRTLDQLLPVSTSEIKELRFINR